MFLRRKLLIHEYAGNNLIRFSPIFLSIFLFSCTVSPVTTVLPEDHQDLTTPHSSPVPSHTAPRSTETPGIHHSPEATMVVETSEDDIQPSNTPPPTKNTCSQKKGTFENGVVESELLGYDLKFQIYLPPCYAESPEEEYPTLYLLHGQGYNQSQWDEIGADEIADGLISSNQVAPFIMIMPYEQLDNNSRGNQFDKAILEELLPYIESNYRTLQDRAGRAVGGISHGGGWAIELGIQNWEVFGALGAHSPAVLNNDPVRLANKLESIPANQMPRIFIDLGDQEPPEISESAEWLGEIFNKKGVPHEWYQFTGAHNQEYWQGHLETYLRWYASAW